MASKFTYEPDKTRFEYIAPELVPRAILSMLCEVRTDIGNLDDSFAKVDLTRVLEVIKSGKYEIEEKTSTHIDLSAVKSIIEDYRKNSKEVITEDTDRIVFPRLEDLIG